MSSINKEIEKIFEQIGEFGPYQLFIIVLVGVIAVPPSLIAYSYSFYGAVPNHRCKIPIYENDTYEIQNDYHKQLIEQYIPEPDSGSLKDEYNKCELKIDNKTRSKCNQWVYSKKYFDSTLATDWNLVCDKASTRSLLTSIYFLGTNGVLLSGILSDKIGRKKTAYAFLIANAILNVGTLLIMVIDFENENFKKVLFSIVRLLTGIAVNIYSIAVVLAIEVVGSSKRVKATNFIYYLYILAEFALLILVYFIRNYKLMYGCITGFIVLIPFYFWILPESPRWLLTKRKNKEALKTFKKIAKSNKKTLDNLFELQTLSQDFSISNEEKKYTVFETIKILFKSKKIIIHSLVLLFNWISNTLVYYGIGFNTSDLAGSPYLNFGISALVEFLAILACDFVLERFGRKIPYSITMGSTGICLLMIMFVPKSMSFIATVLTLISKFSISFSYNTIYIITAESFPTVMRNSSLAIFQTFSRVGAIIFPHIQLLGEIFWYPLPFIIYGTFSSIAALSFIFVIEETKSKKLPDTIEEFVKN